MPGMLAASPPGKPLRHQPAAPDLVRRLARRAQVPLALKNARKTRQTRGTYPRKITSGLTELPVTMATE
jgi:hypothetical protein